MGSYRSKAERIIRILQRFFNPKTSSGVCKPEFFKDLFGRDQRVMFRPPKDFLNKFFCELFVFSVPA